MRKSHPVYKSLKIKVDYNIWPRCGKALWAAESIRITSETRFWFAHKHLKATVHIYSTCGCKGKSGWCDIVIKLKVKQYQELWLNNMYTSGLKVTVDWGLHICRKLSVYLTVVRKCFTHLCGCTLNNNNNNDNNQVQSLLHYLLCVSGVTLCDRFLRCSWAAQHQSLVCFKVTLLCLYLSQCALCLVVVCCGRGLTLTLSQSLQLLSSGRTGKMVKKVCPCNQLCSNYLSFWSFLPPSIHSPHLHPCTCSPTLLPAFWRPVGYSSDPLPDLRSVNFSYFSCCV